MQNLPRQTALAASSALAVFAGAGEPCICHGWRELSPIQPQARSEAALVFDVARQRSTLLGGAGGGFLEDHWTWDGRAWERSLPMPNGRSQHAAAYDRARGLLVLFGGNQAFWQTVLWDGAAWVTRNTATNPNQWPDNPSANLGRNNHAMTFDDARRVTLMHGGVSALGLYPGTLWAFDGVDWMAIAADDAGGPGRRSQHAFAYDSAHDQAVLLGGVAPDGERLADTYVWDGTTWTLRATGGPAARAGHAMAFDRARGVLVLFGGRSGNGALNDTWEWNGSAWTQVFSPTSPGPRSAHSMAFDEIRNVVVLHGGANSTGVNLGDLWEYDGVSWARRVEHAARPLGRERAVMAYDALRDRIVLHGGATNAQMIRETWEWERSSETWQRRTSNGPSMPHQPGGLAFDSARGVTVLYSSNVTSEWNGQTWTQRQNVGTPIADAGFGMAYDTARGQVVLYGGAPYTIFEPGPPLDATWVYDGVAWVQVQSDVPVPPLIFCSLAEDPVAQALLLFGGHTTAGELMGDTWQWNGLDWELVATDGPSPRQNARMAYDGSIDAVVLYGGNDSSGRFDDAWRWDRVERRWTPLAGLPPPPRTGFSMSSLGSAGVFVFGGMLAGGFGDWTDDYWASGFGSACGDANCDGTTNAADSELFATARAGSLSAFLDAGGEITCWSRRSSWLDVTQDGVVDSADDAALAAIIADGGCEGCPGDLDGDLQVDVEDLAVLLAHFGDVEASGGDGDFDRDGDVDLRDLVELLGRFGFACN